jgi:hypothetical protein
MTDTPLAGPTSTPEEPQSVEIHKPKPVHSWREFLREYAIIVLGVLTALAGEQAVEWLHWQGEVKTARQAIQAEMAANEVTLFARRLYLQPCVDRQRREANAILADLEAGRTPRRFTTFHLGAAGPGNNSVWEAQRSAQTLTHFPPEELAMMGRYYIWVSDFADWTGREEERWSELAVLRSPPKGLGASDFTRLRASLAALQRLSGLIENNSVRALRLGDALGIPRPPVDKDRLARFCSMNEEEFVPSVKNTDTGLR